MDLERLYREDHTFFKAIVGDFNAKIGPRRMAEELYIGTHGMEFFRIIPSTTTSMKNTTDSRADTPAWYRASYRQPPTNVRTLCREAIKDDLKERRAAVMDEAAEAGKSIRKA
uniref:Uncharacterized protein n=1 Tax=Haemonchus contortus TaxID=6289 RepID=A0A7I5E8J2_HAECO